MITGVTALHAQTSDISTTDSIEITADKMIAKRNDASTEFIGNVVVIQKESTIKADRIKLFFNEDSDLDNIKDDNPQGRINKIIANGNVEYTSLDRQAFADKAVYLAADETLTLTGNSPKVKTGSSYVTGERIIVYQQQDQVIVEGGSSQRVEALFNPEDRKTE